MRDMRGAVTLAGGRFLEAPVSGSKAPAAQGALIFLCGGDETLYAEVKPELAVMGKADFLFGDVGAGTKMKLVVNMVMGDMMVALSEGLSLCGAAGLPGDAEAACSRSARRCPCPRRDAAFPRGKRRRRLSAVYEQQKAAK
ncbi:3-hydroxyisobutyrate dehydrogenase [Aureococcus anophagefferens]|nr:3-hydroxyisobutyrate dehydrogenase [Aureococcus anophagefferens]